MPEDFKTYNVFEARPKRIAIEYSFAKDFEVFVLLVSWRVSNLVPSQWFWILMLVVTWIFARAQREENIAKIQRNHLYIYD